MYGTKEFWTEMPIRLQASLSRVRQLLASVEERGGSADPEERGGSADPEERGGSAEDRSSAWIPKKKKPAWFCGEEWPPPVEWYRGDAFVAQMPPSEATRDTISIIPYENSTSLVIRKKSEVEEEAEEAKLQPIFNFDLPTSNVQIASEWTPFGAPSLVDAPVFSLEPSASIFSPDPFPTAISTSIVPISSPSHLPCTPLIPSIAPVSSANIVPSPSIDDGTFVFVTTPHSAQSVPSESSSPFRCHIPSPGKTPVSRSKTESPMFRCLIPSPGASPLSKDSRDRLRYVKERMEVDLNDTFAFDFANAL